MKTTEIARKTGHKHRYFFIRLFLFYAASGALLLSLTGLFGCGKADTSARVSTSFGMDTVCSITVYSQSDSEAQAEALKLLSRYERIFSRTDPESELCKLNASAGTETAVSDELYSVLSACLRVSELTSGRFDISLGAVSDLYGFSEDTPGVPSEEELSEALSHTGYEKIHLLPENRVLVEDPGLVIDLGAAAKGYTADRMKELLSERGVESAIINLGGNILTLGAAPSGRPFSVGIARPEKDSSEALFAVDSSGTSVVTSGVYQRSFTEDGVLYHHLLDSSTGLPLRNGLLSVSAVAGDSLTADLLSTACFALGPGASEELLSAFSGVTVYFIAEDLSVTEIP